jgi:Protein of unknown function (DUF2723)
MNNFKKINNITGWAVFAIAFLTYFLTMEQTASFWDCGEFIAVSYKLMVPHPPGAPLFLILGRLFSLLAGGDTTKVAYWINMLSVLASSFSILFLFWTITMLGRKILNKVASELTDSELYLLMGSGAIGALAYTFSDTFWFSAVEAEVYGMSSFFTAIVIWAAFKWELIDDEAAANRWIIFIAYLTGLSIGVHLLNLVTIPALALIYYYKKTEKPNTKGLIFAFIIGVVIIGIINAGVIPGLPSLGFQFELLFVNVFGLPYGAGIAIFCILLVAGLFFGLRYSQTKGKVMLNTALLSLTFILIGYLSYTLVLVRSNFNPPLNENDPSDALNYVMYLKREQYGDRSLLYGPHFAAEVASVEHGKGIYRKKDGKYEVYDYKPTVTYEPGSEMLFPRIGSGQGGHPALYREELNLAEGQKPSFGDNLVFFAKYQISKMYLRYFGWNFVGRESDIQGAGIAPFKNSSLPATLSNNKANNNFYFLPLILGLLGFFYHLNKRDKDWLSIFVVFLMTGLALVVFVNSPPTEPRERDYIYAGSFYAFAIWIGLGVMAIADFLNKFIKNGTSRAGVATLMSLSVPVIMGVQGWDDHNRSNRYHSVDFAKNLLNACAPNAILFTGGDNDTFPLWYVQEVEGFRTDVRVCNLSLLGTDWYINQMKRKTYQSEALPVSLEYNQYISGINDNIPFYENANVKNGINLKDYIDYIHQDKEAIKVQSMNGDMINTLPSSVFFLPINKDAVKKLGIVPKDMETQIVDTMAWSFGKKDIFKPELIQLDMIANNNWKRPIYFSSSISSESYLGLKEYMQVEGMVYRLLPVKVAGATDGYVNTDLATKNMLTKTFWRSMDDPSVYYNEFYTGSPVISSRIAFAKLAGQLIQEGKKDKAKQVLDYSLKVLPNKSIPYDQVSTNFISLYLEVGDKKTALEIADTISKRDDANLRYYMSEGHRNDQEINTNLYELQVVSNSIKEAKLPEASKYEAIFNKYYKMTEQ